MYVGRSSALHPSVPSGLRRSAAGGYAIAAQDAGMNLLLAALLFVVDGHAETAQSLLPEPGSSPRVRAGAAIRWPLPPTPRRRAGPAQICRALPRANQTPGGRLPRPVVDRLGGRLGPVGAPVVRDGDPGAKREALTQVGDQPPHARREITLLITNRYNNVHMGNSHGNEDRRPRSVAAEATLCARYEPGTCSREHHHVDRPPTVPCRISAPHRGQLPPGCRAAMTSPVCTPPLATADSRADSSAR